MSSLGMPGGAMDTIERANEDDWLPYYGPTPIAAKQLEYNDDRALSPCVGKVAASAGPVMVQAAAGHDVTPGNDRLHHYWVAGPGLARWRTWTELLAGLVEEVEGKPLETLKRWASAWFFERYGFHAGDDRNRVMNGKPPRGKVVGPG